MARKRGKKALYEVMSKARNKPGFGRTLKKMCPKKPEPKKDEPVTNKKPDEPVTNKKPAADVETSKTAAKWWRKPRVVQFNLGRVEFSMPYQLAIALLLILILLVLATFRLGQFSHPSNQETVEPTGKMQRLDQENPMGRASANIMQPSAALSNTQGLESAQSIGDHVIVLVEYETRAHLVPVQEYFAEHDIDTEIVMENGRYFLQTKNRYQSTKTPGSDGYEAKKRIAELGAKYRAPAGYETFAPHFFSDAYGKKVK